MGLGRCGPFGLAASLVVACAAAPSALDPAADPATPFSSAGPGMERVTGGLPPKWAPGSPAPEFVPDQLIVGFADEVSDTGKAEVRARSGVQVVEPLSGASERWNLPAGSDVRLLARSVAALPGIRYAQPNTIRRTQAYTAGEFTSADVRTDPLWHLALLDAGRAWGVPAAGGLAEFGAADPPGKGVLVAVVDSGVDVRHPDLAARVSRDTGGGVRFLDEVKACGRTDVLYTGGNALTYDYSTAYRDSTHPGPDGNGHGTHIAGIIAAAGGNNPGLSCADGPCNTVGLGPGISILPVKTMNALGDGDDFCIAKGLRDAADAGARVINLSVGGPQRGPALEEAIEYLSAKGALLVAASGNDGMSVNFPAAYAGAVAVGAVGHPAEASYPEALSGTVSYSSSGPELDLVAPGGSATGDCPERRCGVYSTVPTYTSYVSSSGKVPGPMYGRLTGTSMATALVSAAAALVLSREPGLSARQLRQRLLAAARPVPGATGPFSDRYGHGLVDPARALGEVSHDGR